MSLDRQVILGNHRDAWVFGAVDPNSATAVLMEMARTLSVLRQNSKLWLHEVKLIETYHLQCLYMSCLYSNLRTKFAVDLTLNIFIYSSVTYFHCMDSLQNGD